ncbi:conserved Plasmodium protein, unknown function [Plasmodium berghei]|uniref:Nuclear speckle splicing regulatory protein 1 N-terminal domain-containing protein n=3 Tax=Plasmodium berghei TaxID=5821 RepID=A0A509AQ28_PLABA|nr:conserved Plasmodium protein, unknown function [Plasmodium berghei ANKA]CXI68949.1 conserved Plasmodium protein, unknown function [Plasmodium berghei]SCM24215.1 conserved Plasmodium protein, unknown function [Plasmodium berghei]SCN26998.1 conserved Plasmodium protein, unknown function [Plasmodium berghei]SCO61442.1 conserved Plasmodium protein, unknown function [Plasmodium berghei]SCO63420.1 conserved Plasmodium protein, unknown function [Plasmodium berghei]|eukprot:XP_034422614.1 conserved Plasmodium protein, unknown function [Plasmodium berghei ANKA]
MKISLSFNKKKKKEENETKESKQEQNNNDNFQDNKKEINERDQIKNVFHSSSDEEIFDFENNHNKKIVEKKKKKIENEIKEYIYEHENAPIQENKNEEDKKAREKPKKIIQYLGYKGEELTKFYSDKLKDVKKNYHSISSSDEYKKSVSSREIDNDTKRKRYKPDLKKMNTGSHKDYNREQNYDKIKKKKNDDDLSIDEIFTKKENNNKSKYMDALINSSKRRMMEKEILIQNKLKIDTEKDKVFVTSAYKKKLAERQLIKQDIEEENEHVEPSNHRSLNFNLFLKNINAPSNYNRNNRLYNENQNLEDF